MTRPIPDPAQEAARWLARDDLDHSPHREAFSAWLDASEENREAWSKAHAMWDIFDKAEENDLIAAMARAARQAKPEPVVRPYWPQLIAASIAWKHSGSYAIRQSMKSTSARRPTSE